MDDPKTDPSGHNSLHRARWRFYNPYPGYQKKTLGELLRWVIIDRWRGQKIKRKMLYSLQQAGNDGSYLRANKSEFTATWAGHSTVLIQLDGVNILTDPIWSRYPSPVPFAGPKRYMEHGIAFKNLPHIDVIILSHNHYDHFDRATIRRFGAETLFIVPLGFGRELRKLGIFNYVELDWWKEHKFRNLTFICTPAQHYSTRRFADKDRTLWSSWVIRNNREKVFFAGDSGYFPGFKEIGDKFGPFDLVCLPIGAYLPRHFMANFHMNPAEAVKAYQDLRGQIFLAIHWGTFNLGSDPPDLGPKDLKREIERLHLDSKLFWPLMHGETRLIKEG